VRRVGRPAFGGGDLFVADNCNANTDSHTAGFGYAYDNDTGIGGLTFFFTGATPLHGFKVREIEVFEIVG
jgi:hypothetical protein